MGDEQTAKAIALLKFGKEIENLRPHRDVKRRDGFIGDHKSWTARKRTGNCHTLTLASRHFMRVTIGVIATETHIVERIANPLGLLARRKFF